MRFLFGKTEAELAVEKTAAEAAKVAAEKAAFEARWGRVKRDHKPGMSAADREQAAEAYNAKQDAAYAEKGRKWNAELVTKKSEPAAVHFNTYRGELEDAPLTVKGKKKNFSEETISALKSHEARQNANIAGSQFPQFSRSNYQSHDAPSKKELDAQKKAFWHAKNEAERTKIEAFKKTTEAKTVATQTASLDQVKVEVTGPKKPTFFEVSAARRNAILEARKALTAQEKAAKARENIVESCPKPGFGM